MPSTSLSHMLNINSTHIITPVQLANSGSQSSVKPSTDIAEWAMQGMFIFSQIISFH